MTEITNLNVSPYYDDFDKDDNFHKVLFRPGFAVQARELTTLQSILQDQIASQGKHIFKEGTVVIPGQISLSNYYTSVQLATTFGGEDVVPSQYYNITNPVIITGSTSGIKAKVIGYADATSTTQPTLYVQYVQTGSDNTTDVFSNSENITADTTITHTTSYSSGVAAATTHTTASQIGTAVKVESGIYFVRGQFVRCTEQTLVLDSNITTSSARVGFTVTETLITPEADASLTDNATGSANYAAKGAHRLKISLSLSKLDLDSADDTSFIELMRIRNGVQETPSRVTEYSVLGDTLARRTHDESGDYTVRPFQFDVRESIDNDYKGKTNKGVYSSGAKTNNNATASEDLLAFQISPGKAYVKGYEIEKMTNTFLDIGKARDFNTVNAGIATFELGNSVDITNAFQIPDIGAVTGESTAYKTIGLFDETTVTRGSASGTQIGVARARSIEHLSGTQGSTTATMKMFLFDVRPFTFLTLNATPNPTLNATHSNGGVQIKGATSGATGFVHGPLTSGTTIALTTVIGTFISGERLTASDSTLTGKLIQASTTAGAGHNDSVTTITLTSTAGFSTSGTITIGSEQITYTDKTPTTLIGATRGANSTTAAAHDNGVAVTQIINIGDGSASIVSKRFSDVRSFFMDDADGGQDFTADAVLELIGESGSLAFDGTDVSSADAGSNILLDTVGDAGGKIVLEDVRVARLKNPEKNVGLFKLPKSTIKTLLTTANAGASDTQFTVRRNFVGTTNAAGVVTFSAGTNETFVGFSTVDYTLSVLTAGDGTAVAGDIILLNSTKVTTTGTSTLTITDSTLLGNNAKVKLFATLLKTSVVTKTKTTQLSKQLNVIATDADGAYGTRSTDKDISLGRTDVFKLQAVFDSEDTSAAATAPQFTVSNVVGTFLRGEKITGGSSNAVGRIISTTSPISYTLTAGSGATDFTAAETITGASSGATATVGTLTAGSKVITNSFVLDTGQRDNFYDIARLVRKPSAATPIGQLLVVYDFFSHGNGDAFTVDSYTSIAGQMEYDNIPTYTATRVDPDEPEPTGVFDLRDCFDFRPSIEDIAGTSTTLASIDTVTGNSFDFFSRQYDGVGASTVDTPKPASSLQADFEFYLSKFASLYLLSNGRFKLVDGVSAENPVEPADVSDGMKLATIFIPAFTFSPKDVNVKRYKTQRFTMRDIGRLKERLETVESLTALSLLERDAESFEIQDANGLNRFKSGFVVDNFSGHRVGDAANKDYKIAVDQQLNELRPKCVLRSADLIENVTTDAERTAAGYQKTGDLITLPYTNEVLFRQPYATRVENVQPFLLSSWVGQITLTPSGDEWFETEVAPDLIINVDGNFDTVLAENRNSIGTVWNSWETQWSGVVGSSTDTRWIGNALVERTVQTTRTNLNRTGLQTNVVENIEEESQGTRVISRALIPFVRPRAVSFIGQGFLPNTRLYVFFDETDVNAYVTPSSSSYTSDTTIIAGSPLITTASGKIEGTFNIPDYKFAGQGNVPKFRTGEIEFRMTSSSTNGRAGLGGVTKEPSTAGSATYLAKGILETEQETIIATRNAIVAVTGVSQSTSRDSSSTRSRVLQVQDQGDGNDPLAQTFLINEEGGCFIPSIDLFFAKKDNNLPVWVEIRNVVNGYPGAKILPFGRKLLESSEVNVDDTSAATATTFTFDSPVYLQQGIEYCVVIQTHSLDYLMWISQLGEIDVGGSNRLVSRQPFLGVLFKSQNNRTWNSVQAEDLKFTLNKCKFSTDDGVVTLTNDFIGDAVTSEDGSTTVYGKRLQPNPFKLTNASTVMQVLHREHGMYSTSNNVTITGASSGITTTLNGSIAAQTSATTITLASNPGTAFVPSNLQVSSTDQMFIKIDNEIIRGTLSTLTFTSNLRGVAGTTVAAHSSGATIELYQLAEVPLTEINKTHTAIANIDMDSYTVALTTAPTVSGASTIAEVGGINTYATENYRFETFKTQISKLELPKTSIVGSIKSTSGTSPSGTETSFITETSSNTFALGENFDLDTTRIVCSTINESNELAGAKSLFIPLTLSTTNPNVTPVIDLDRASMLAIGNELNKIDSSSDVYANYNASTEPEGDNNAAIYITKKVALENPATALKVFFAGNVLGTAEVEVLFKILRSDSADDFDDLGYEFFNTDGSPDSTVATSLARTDFQQYVYSAGVKDDGIGDSLPEFIQFAIKIVMKGTNSAQPPKIKDLRAIALAT